MGLGCLNIQNTDCNENFEFEVIPAERITFQRTFLTMTFTFIEFYLMLHCCFYCCEGTVDRFRIRCYILTDVHCFRYLEIQYHMRIFPVVICDILYIVIT